VGLLAARPSPAPPTSSRSTAPACSSPTNAPPNSPRRYAATGTLTRDIYPERTVVLAPGNLPPAARSAVEAQPSAR
jgi:hypothetical protein